MNVVNIFAAAVSCRQRGMLGASYIPDIRSKTTPTRLPIPPLVDGSQGRPIDLQIRSGTWYFRSGVETPTLGFSQEYLGPTIRTRQHSELNCRYRNTLTESVAVHGHGLHVPGEVDGGPQLAIEPGADWQPSLSIVQPAATCWYHSHTHGKTGEQTYRGLAGLIIIDDEVADSLPLPRRYGVDDLPIVIQDLEPSMNKVVWSIHCMTRTRMAGWVTPWSSTVRWHRLPTCRLARYGCGFSTVPTHVFISWLLPITARFTR